MNTHKVPTGNFPTIGRKVNAPSLLFLVSVGIIMPRAALAQQRLTEAEVIRLARTQSPASRIVAATESILSAQAQEAGLLPNPSLNWARETVNTGPQGGRGSQDLLFANLSLDVAGPLTRRALATANGAWMRAEASLEKTQSVLATLMRYYDAVLAQRRVTVLQRAVEDLEEAARVLARREAAGSASGYESLRLTVARDLSHSHLGTARGQLESAKSSLAALLGLSAEEIRIEDVDDALHALAVSPEDHSVHEAVVLADSSEASASKARDRASWSWFPSIDVTGGAKRANNAGTANGYGYTVGLALSVPLFDRGQTLRTEADALRELSMARVDALNRRLTAETRSALLTYQVTSRELQRLEETSKSIEALLRAATSGYREGERTIVELLDAQRARTEVAERHLTLRMTAKRAEARLRAARGEF